MAILQQLSVKKQASGSTLLHLAYLQVVATWLFCSLPCILSAPNNITAILEGNPDYSTLNDLLTKTGVDKEIDGRNSVTLLAADNAAMAPLEARLGNDLTLNQVADILRYHVILEYYNPTQLGQLSNGTTLAPTLYQSTGRAAGQLGFVNLTDGSSGTVDVGLPVKGAGFNATIMKSVHDVPYNISVLELSNPLIPEGLLAAAPVPTPAPTPVPVPAPAPSPLSSPAPSPLLAPIESPSAIIPAAPKPSSSLPVVASTDVLARVILLSVIALTYIIL